MYIVYNASLLYDLWVDRAFFTRVVWLAKCLKTVHEYEKGYVREENTKKYYYTFKTADLKERPWKNKHQNCAEN